MLVDCSREVNEFAATSHQVEEKISTTDRDDDDDESNSIQTIEYVDHQRTGYVCDSFMLAALVG